METIKMVFKDIRKIALDGLTQFFHLPIGYHLIFGMVVRLVLILYADVQDSMFDVKYTDVDYKVYTDAARHVLKGESPFQRHTYRYSPLIAWMLVPNIFLHENFGKVLFCVFDIMITLAIKTFIQRQLRSKINAARVAKYSSLFWLYNPLSIGISTRGNADSVSCFFIIMSLFFLQTNKIKNNMKYVLSGMFLGIAIHLRLYPIVFSLPMYMSVGDYKITRNTSIKDGLISLIPNRKQITLAVTTMLYFVSLTYGMYLVYGYKFLFETYIYHVFRKDTRHNFSVFFYTSYLTMTDVTFDLIKFTSQIFVSIILFLLSLAFGCDYQTLPFALFCQAAVLVIYNSVVTSQYFIWFLSLFPLIVQDIKANLSEGLFLALMWVGGQAAWLLYAYLLEFQNQPVFIILWVMGTFFFGSNIAVLYQLIKMYTPGYCYGISNTSFRAKTK